MGIGLIKIMDDKFLARPSGSIDYKVHSAFQLEPKHGSFPEILVEGLHPNGLAS